MRVETPLLQYVVLAPLAGFLFNGFLGRRVGKTAVGLAGCLSVFTSFALALVLAGQLRRAPSGMLHQTVFEWLPTAVFSAPCALLLDRLSLAMALVVSGVGGLIHLYSLGYMGKDQGYARYFAYLNLFSFAMLLLVLADNLLLMFVGWEGVGLCSYLLIGFWYEDMANAEAGKKAFLTNRVGDFGFVLGMLLLLFGIYQLPGVSRLSLDYSLLQQQAGALSAMKICGLPLVSLACLLLFIGATGKSAQIPLHVWLPDAMAGPTPVSALIHAATMVTAGIYLVARLHFLFVLTPAVLAGIALVGAATAFFAATVALQQFDIKKVLAYSTISQLGYMFAGVATLGFAAGTFHLVTHAFFKALLFLGAGSVIYALHHVQDIRAMGGLWRKLPLTCAAFLIGALALSGFPLTSGFFSKDDILWSAWLAADQHRQWLYPAVALSLTATAWLTALYMARLWVLTFWGEYRGSAKTLEHFYRPPLSMTLALVILSLLSLVGGWPLFGMERFLAAHFPEGPGPATAFGIGEAALGWGISAVGLGVFALGCFLYQKRQPWLEGLRRRHQLAVLILENKYFIDELYRASAVRGTMWLSRICEACDRRLIDGLIDGLAALARWGGAVLSRISRGQVQAYAYSMFLGLLFILGYFLWKL